MRRLNITVRDAFEVMTIERASEAVILALVESGFTVKVTTEKAVVTFYKTPNFSGGASIGYKVAYRMTEKDIWVTLAADLSPIIGLAGFAALVDFFEEEAR